jgi:hypothetical protein
MTETQVEIPLQYELVDVGLLDNNSWNPNTMEQAEFDRLCKEIEETGFLVPLHLIALEGGRLLIIGGEHRAAAARELKMAKVPAVILQGPRFNGEELQKLLTVRLNSLHGKTNPEKMALLYNEMAKKYGDDALQDLFAFTDKHAWKKLVSQIKKGLSDVGLPKKQRDKFDEQVKEAKTLQDLERILNDMWSSYGDTVQQSFMIFTYGRRDHIYIAMDRDMRKSVKKITEHCKKTGQDINTVLGPALRALSEVLAKKTPKTPAKKDSGVAREDDVPF